MTDTPNRPPLWRVMQEAGDEAATIACRDFGSMLARCKAAEIRCPACEGVPKPGNQPCAVCGRSAPPAEGEVGEATLVRRMCEIILGNTFGNKELDSLALLVGHHPDVLNASPVPVPVAKGEVGELVTLLRQVSDGANACDDEGTAWITARAADLLEQRHPTPVPAGMIPVEYWDIDSGARIVSEPSEDGPGGCWIVLNSRHINPLDEFPTAQAAWDALQQATALPLSSGEVE